MVYGDKKRPPPQAFMGSGESRVQAQINIMANKMFEHARKPYGAVDLMNLFVDPAYHGPMQIAFMQNHGGSLTQSLYVDIANFAPENVEAAGFIQFSWNYETTPNGFFPRYSEGGSTNFPIKEWGAAAQNHFNLVERFAETARQVVRVSYEWGLVKKVFAELNQPGFCSTPQQMRYVWPSILPILKAIKNDRDDALARSMQNESSRAGDKARVPRAVQPLLRESYQIVTRSIIVLDHPTEDKLKDIRYNMLSPKFKTQGLEFDGATAFS